MKKVDQAAAEALDRLIGTLDEPWIRPLLRRAYDLGRRHGRKEERRENKPKKSPVRRLFSPSWTDDQRA